MTELKIELPVKINGVIFTENVRRTIGDFQTDGSLEWDIPDYNNGGIASMNKYISDIYNYFIHAIAIADKDDPTREEMEMLTNLYWIRERINDCRVPDKLLSDQ